MAHRNFARGDAPPSHSYEWAGVAKPPEVSGKTPARKPPIPVMVSISETLVIKKKRPWLWALGGAIAGFFLGHKTARY